MRAAQHLFYSMCQALNLFSRFIVCFGAVLAIWSIAKRYTYLYAAAEVGCSSAIVLTGPLGASNGACGGVGASSDRHGATRFNLCRH